MLYQHLLSFNGDKVLLAELPQCATDVRNAQSKRVADQRLRQWHLIGVLVGQADHLQPGEQLEQPVAFATFGDDFPIAPGASSCRLTPH